MIKYVKILDMNKQNFHVGHRKRLTDKFLKNADALSEHELLEILLFYAIPRVNTNETAHRLISSFGSLEKVFGASKQELMAVAGVGEKVAVEIMLVGSIFKVIAQKKKESLYIGNYYEFTNYLCDVFRNEKTEKFVLLLLKKNYEVIAQYWFSDDKSASVSADMSDLAQLLTINKPYRLLLAHNHPSGDCLPSDEDDKATAKIYMLCSMCGMRLEDHVIVGDKFYSYRSTDRLKRIAEKADINRVLERI